MRVRSWSTAPLGALLGAILVVSLASGLSAQARPVQLVKPVRAPRRSASQVLARIRAVPGGAALLHAVPAGAAGATSGELTLARPSIVLDGGTRARLQLLGVDVVPTADGSAVATSLSPRRGYDVVLELDAPGGSGTHTYAVLFDIGGGSGGLSADPATVTLSPSGSGQSTITYTRQALAASADGSGVMSCPAVLTLSAGRWVGADLHWPASAANPHGFPFVAVSVVRIN